MSGSPFQAYLSQSICSEQDMRFVLVNQIDCDAFGLARCAHDLLHNTAADHDHSKRYHSSSSAIALEGSLSKM